MKQQLAETDVSIMQASAPLYPTLPPAEAPSSYRIQQICELRQKLEEEKENRASLYKKYRRVMNSVDGVDTALLTASMAMGVSGVGLLTTVIAAPVVLGLEIAAVACGVIAVGGKFISRRMAVKAQKHNEIRILADSKLNTISDHVSTALVDGEISQGEFKLILDEVHKYKQMRDKIRAEARQSHAAVLNDETKNFLIKQGREEARASFIKKLAMSDSPAP